MKSAQKGESVSHLVIIALFQAIAYTGVWLWNEYVASYFTLIFPAVILVILLVAFIADLIEPSRIPWWYYGLMIVSIVVPVLIGAVFYFINDGIFEWLTYAHHNGSGAGPLICK